MNNCPQSVVSCQISGVSFSLSNSEKIRKLSVKRIYNPILFDELGHPTRNGLYDPALGPLDKQSLCATCSLSYHSCPGHFGHIELVLPVYNPVLFGKLYELLRITCPYCQHIIYKDSSLSIFLAKMTLLDAGALSVAAGLDDWSEDWIQRHKHDKDADETLFLKAMNKHVARAISDEIPSDEPSRLVEQSTHVARLRHDVIKVFLKSAATTKTCPHCEGHIPRLVKVGHGKIFEKSLSPQSQRVMQTKNLQRYPFANTNEEEEEREISHSAKTKRAKIPDDTMNQSSLPEDEDDDDEEERSEDESNSQKQPKLNETYLTCIQLREHLLRVFKRHSSIMTYVFGFIQKETEKQQSCKTIDANMFFLDVLPVAPTRFRPANKMDDQTFEHPQNVSLSEILRLNESIFTILFPNQQTRNPNDASLKKGKDQLPSSLVIPSARSKGGNSWMTQWMELQRIVNALFDSTKAGDVRQQQATPAGIRQLLEKKEGLFRKHMMGKRVNFAARSVISPDPYLDTNEIGLPAVFATRLTYPEPVTPFNVAQLRLAVMNGPNVHPGATHVQLEDGTLISLAHFSQESRTALSQTLLTPSMSTGSTTPSSHHYSSMHTSNGTEKQSMLDRAHTNKKVIRHIQNGDVVLVNRQPTLHKPSIMAHRVRVLPGEKTLRMHYANCDTYNADFDGDEMNIHFPQNEVARAEAYTICETDQQYLVPTDGTPLRGLIQDHIGTSVLMTCKDTLLSPGDYQQLVFNGLPRNLDARPILTLPPTILKPRVLYTGKQVITTLLMNLLRDSLPLNLLSKTKLDEAAWGGSSHSDETRVIIEDNHLLQGVLDKSQLGASPYGLVHACFEVYGAAMAGKVLTACSRLLTCFLQSTAYTCGLDDLILTPKSDEKRVDLLKKEMVLSGQQVIQSFMTNNTHLSTHDQLLMMTRDDQQLISLDGRMRSRMNRLTTQVIDACLPEGQIRPFPWNNMSLMILSGAKGSKVNFSQISCLLGQQELEGRRVPIMVSGKTLPCFWPLETSARAGGYIANRFLSGIQPQEYFFHCMAGREGLIDTAVKTARSGYLQRCLIKHLEGLRVHYDGTVRDLDHSIVQFLYGEDSLDVSKKSYLNDFDFAAKNFKALARRYNPGSSFVILDEHLVLKAQKKAREKPSKYPPVLSQFHPGTHFGSISESFDLGLEKYLLKLKEEDNHHAIKLNSFRSLMWLKYMRSLVDAGEAVGVLAAQSIGEPSTQMTLNTFHFAGHGAQNVTLGIPRLREIIMTASKSIKTPTMKLPLLENVNVDELNAFIGKLNRLTLPQIVRDITVTETLQNGMEGRQRIYTIRLVFKNDQFDQFHVTGKEVANAVERQVNGFIHRLHSHLQASLKKKKKFGGNETLVVTSQRMKENTNGEDDDEGGDGMEDGIQSRRMNQAKSQGPSLSDSEEEEEDQDDDEEEGKVHGKRVNQEREDDDEDEEILPSSGKAEIEDSTPSKVTLHGGKADKLKQRYSCVKDYSYDHHHFGWCELTLAFSMSLPKLLMISLVEKALAQVVVLETKGISQAELIEDTSSVKGGKTIITSGANFYVIWQHAHECIINPNQIYSNDIAHILETYGVEAARAAISMEIASVFKAYGISVDARHLLLIADYMTFEGGYRPFNRRGMETSTSPFAKMSFETTMEFLKETCLRGDYDVLQSPSARLVVGEVVSGGTGCFDIRQPLLVV